MYIVYHQHMANSTGHGLTNGKVPFRGPQKLRKGHSLLKNPIMCPRFASYPSDLGVTVCPGDRGDSYLRAYGMDKGLTAATWLQGLNHFQRALWYVDEVERLWQQYTKLTTPGTAGAGSSTVHGPIRAVEVDWSAATGGITKAHVQSIIDFTEWHPPPSGVTKPGVYASNGARQQQRSSKGTVAASATSACFQQRVACDYKYLTLVFPADFLRTPMQQTRTWWWVERGVQISEDAWALMQEAKGSFEVDSCSESSVTC